MKRSTVWIDHHKAHILDFSANGINHRNLAIPEAHGKPSHEQLRKFYHEVAQSLKDIDCMLVAGPGLAKDEFKNHCEEHHPKLAKAIVDVKPMKDHPSHEEILKFSHDYFSRYMNWAPLS